MDPLSIIGLVASVAQLVQLTAHTSKLLKTASDRFQNAPESIRETQRYVERLGGILRVIAARNPGFEIQAMAGGVGDGRQVVKTGSADATDIEPDPMDEYLGPLLVQVKEDLEELGKEMEGLFVEDSTMAARTVARRKGIDAASASASASASPPVSASGIPTSTVNTPLTVASAKTKAATKMFKNAYDRNKVRIKAYYKDDKIRELKTKIEGHIHVFTFVFSAEALSHSRRSAEGAENIKSLIATYQQQTQQQTQQLALQQKLYHQQLLYTQAYTFKMLESGLDPGLVQEYRKLNIEPPPLPKYSNNSCSTTSFPLDWKKHPLPARRQQSQIPDFRVAQTQKTYRHLGWKWAVHDFGIGHVSIATSEHQVTTDYGLEEEYNIPNEEESWKILDLMISMPWLSSRVLKATFRSGGTQVIPGFTYHISMPVFNSNPDLLDASRRCDVKKLRVLFARKQAHPTDLLAPFGKSLLHEAVLSYAVGKKDARDMIELLLSLLQGNINVRSMDGKTPLLLCCKTSAGHSRILKKMEPITQLLLANGADMSLQDANGQSSAQLLFSSGGIASIQTAFLHRVDVVEFQNMNQLDTWMFTSIARVDHTFKAKLQQQLKELRADPSISGDHRVYSTANVLDMSITKQVKELLEANPKVRSVFMRAVCAHGTAEMLEPLLRRGINPNEEFENLEDNNISYLGEAALAGKLANIEVLLSYGADINAGARYRPLDAILERWARSRDRNLYYKEKHILERLLAVPGCWSADAVTRAIYSYHDDLVERLLQAGFGRNEFHPCVGLYRESGCEAVEAIKHQNMPALQLLIKYKKNLDYPDRGGYTALLHALDKGYSEYVGALVKGNVDVRRKTEYGFSAWDLVNINRNGPHPRRPALEGTMGYTEKFKSIDQDTDEKMYEIVWSKMMQTGGIDIKNNRWISYTTNKVTAAVHRDFRADYERFRVWWDTHPPTELLFVTGVLALTLCMFVVMQAYETLWWIFRSRRPPRAKDLPTIFILLGAVSMYLWKTRL